MSKHQANRWHRWLPWLTKSHKDTAENTTDEALRAIRIAQHEGHQAQQLWKRIDPVTETLRNEYQRNHFAERFGILGGGRKA